MSLPRIAPYDLPTKAELPTPRAPWVFDPARAALLIHDMQHYFVNAFTPEAAPIAPAIANLARLAALCRAAAIPVFYTCQPGKQDPRDRGLQKDLWGTGMTSSPEHRDVTAALAPAAGDIVITKHRYSAFQRSNLETLMRVRGRDQLVIGGVFGHIGCQLTAAEAFQRDIEPFMVADALADFSRARHDACLDYLAACLGVPLMTQDLETQLS